MFNVRVYGLLQYDNRILLADELIKGMEITKFPGGGLEFGEGTIDCLKREFMEELNQPIEEIRHFYTTDFFQLSAFNPNHQIISIYYLVKPAGPIQFETKLNAFDFDEKENDACIFRWVHQNELSSEMLTLPIDKIVAELYVKSIANK
ncbi:MAG: NUDIX domain-containing protein [Bacteroidia bacterium]